jgi:regulator of replication initiation timing
MKSRIYRSAAPLITRIRKLFSEDLAQENDFLRQENKILRSKLGKRVPGPLPPSEYPTQPT